MCLKSPKSMKKIYLEPLSIPFGIVIEAMVCLSGGQAGGDGKPGADFNNGDIFEYDGQL